MRDLYSIVRSPNFYQHGLLGYELRCWSEEKRMTFALAYTHIPRRLVSTLGALIYTGDHQGYPMISMERLKDTMGMPT